MLDADAVMRMRPCGCGAFYLAGLGCGVKCGACNSTQTCHWTHATIIVEILCHFELRVLGPSLAAISDGNEAANAIQVSKISTFALLWLSTDFYHRIPLHSIYDRRIRIMRRILF
jgi:hypothetical protein